MNWRLAAADERPEAASWVTWPDFLKVVVPVFIVLAGVACGAYLYAARAASAVDVKVEQKAEKHDLERHEDQVAKRLDKLGDKIDKLSTQVAHFYRRRR